MRILIIGLNWGPEQTGIAPYTTGMASALAGAGHRVRAITTYPHYPEWRFRDDSNARIQHRFTNGVEVVRVRHRLPREGTSISRVVSELSFGLRALTTRWGTADVVVLVSPAMFASALVSLRVALHPHQRLIVWAQDLYGPGVRETSAGDRFGVLSRLVSGTEAGLLRRADGVVVIHDGMVEETVASYRVDPGRTHVVRNWSHVSDGSRTDRSTMRDRLGWSLGETIVLHTGNMGAKQALVNVLEAARLADQRDAPLRFVLMGDGSARAGLEVQGAGIERLQIVDGLPELDYVDALRAADVLLVNEHPDLRATALPSKLTSYFASGLPIVAATNEHSLTAAEVRRSGAGLRIDAGDPDALLDVVLHLRDDPQEARRLGEAGPPYLRANLTERAALARFQRVLERVTGRPRSGAKQLSKVGHRGVGRDVEIDQYEDL